MLNKTRVSRPIGYQYNIPGEKKYVSEVQGFLLNSEDHPFMNDSSGHAMLLIDQMIGAAERDVIIYTWSARRDCYEAAFLVLPESVKVRILYEDDQCDRWWESIPTLTCEAHKIVSQPVFKGETVNHFYVVDDIAFRYEVIHDRSTATANFNNPDVCRGLTNIFEEAWATSSRAPKENSTATAA